MTGQGRYCCSLTPKSRLYQFRVEPRLWPLALSLRSWMYCAIRMPQTGVPTPVMAATAAASGSGMIAEGVVTVW